MRMAKYYLKSKNLTIYSIMRKREGNEIKI